MTDKTLVADISDVEKIYQSYADFVAGGGLFIPTEENFRVGDLIEVSFKLPNKKDPVVDEGSVVMSTVAARPPYPKGVLLQFNGPGIAILHKLETLISERISSNDPTYII